MTELPAALWLIGCFLLTLPSAKAEHEGRLAEPVDPSHALADRLKTFLELKCTHGK